MTYHILYTIQQIIIYDKAYFTSVHLLIYYTDLKVSTFVL